MGGGSANCKTWTKIGTGLSSAALIWPCDVINDEKGMSMIKKDENDESYENL